MNRYFLLPCFVVLMACASKPYSKSNKTYKKQAADYAALLKKYPLQDSFTAGDFVGTTNFGVRKPSMVILHHTAQNSCDQTLKTFTNPSTKVSSHYVVCREGKVFHMLNDLFRGQHAGVSSWGGGLDINSSSIGIEIDNNGAEPFTEAQINSLLLLLQQLKTIFNIQPKHFVGHADVAPCRKVDPSRYFPWETLAKSGYGIWYDTTNLALPENFDPMLGLRIIGYDISKPECAIQSYKIHFVPTDTTQVISDADRKIIYSLMTKSL
jgi:N-acetylmuramoyl-L-alanine amidase